MKRRRKETYKSHYIDNYWHSPANALNDEAHMETREKEWTERIKLIDNGNIDPDLNVGEKKENTAKQVTSADSAKMSRDEGDAPDKDREAKCRHTPLDRRNSTRDPNSQRE